MILHTLLPIKPQGVINDREIRVHNNDTLLDSGDYTFSFIKEGKPMKRKRATPNLYKKIEGLWKTMNHRSSAMPEKIAEILL